TRRVSFRGDRGARPGCPFETLVRACLMVVDQELLDHGLQLAGTEDQQVVEQLPAGCKNEPLKCRRDPARRFGSWRHPIPGWWPSPPAVLAVGGLGVLAHGDQGVP